MNLDLKDIKDKIVFIHLNLTETRNKKQKIYSVKDAIKTKNHSSHYPYKCGKLIGHISGEFIVKNASFSVNENERLRVNRDKKKYVHAGVCGELLFNVDNFDDFLNSTNKVSYNPYIDKFFHMLNKQNERKPIFFSNFVIFNNNGVFIPEDFVL